MRGSLAAGRAWESVRIVFVAILLSGRKTLSTPAIVRLMPNAAVCAIPVRDEPCAVAAIGRCAVCSRPFCGSHRAFVPALGGPVPASDLCATCHARRTDSVARQEEKRREERSHEEQRLAAMPVLAVSELPGWLAGDLRNARVVDGEYPAPAVAEHLLAVGLRTSTVRSSRRFRRRTWTGWYAVTRHRRPLHFVSPSETPATAQAIFLTVDGTVYRWEGAGPHLDVLMQLPPPSIPSLTADELIVFGLKVNRDIPPLRRP